MRIRDGPQGCGTFLCLRGDRHCGDHELITANPDLKRLITPWLYRQLGWFQRQMVFIQPLELFGGDGHVDFDPAPDIWELAAGNISVCDAQQNRIAAKGYPHQRIAALRGL